MATVAAAYASREPLAVLRAASRWTLELRGARFLSNPAVRFQTSLNDCGPTALAEFLELQGVRAPLADSLRRLSSTTPRGTTLAALGAAARSMGLPVFTVRWDPADLARLPLPSLVWVERRHFVVVAARSPFDSVEVLDPAAGRYRMASVRFERIWSGAALVPMDSISLHRGSDD